MPTPKNKKISTARWKHILSERVQQLPASEFDQILRISKENKNVISLGPGEPDFDAPKPVIDFTAKMLEAGKTHYSSTSGLAELKEAIAKKLAKDNHVHVEDPQTEICVTAGSTEGLILGLMTIVDPGEEVFVPNPGFLAYTPMVDLVTGFAIQLPLVDTDGFQLHPEIIAEKCTEKTRALILNTPSNPTGTVIKKKVLEEIADIIVEKDLIVLSDEAYEKFVFGKEKHVSFASLNGMFDHTLTLQTMSKSYAMPGYRIGYVAGHHELIAEINRIHIYTSLAPSTANQYGALKALQLPPSYVEKMRKSYAERRDLMLKLIHKTPSLHLEKEPEGAFYMFPRITEGKTSQQYAHDVLNRAQVLVVPGNEFGSKGQGFVRMSYATQKEKIQAAFERMWEKGF